MNNHRPILALDRAAAAPSVPLCPGTGCPRLIANPGLAIGGAMRVALFGYDLGKRIKHPPNTSAVERASTQLPVHSVPKNVRGAEQQHAPGRDQRLFPGLGVAADTLRLVAQ